MVFVIRGAFQACFSVVAPFGSSGLLKLKKNPSTFPAVFFSGKKNSNRNFSTMAQETKATQFSVEEVKEKMQHPEDRETLEERVKHGETVVKGGTGGKSLDYQVRLAEGRSKGGHHRAEDLGHEGYQEMGKKGGHSTLEKSGGEAAAEKGVEIDEPEFKK